MGQISLPNFGGTSPRQALRTSPKTFDPIKDVQLIICHTYGPAFFFFAFAFFLLRSLGFKAAIPALQMSAYRT